MVEHRARRSGEALPGRGALPHSARLARLLAQSRVTPACRRRCAGRCPTGSPRVRCAGRFRERFDQPGGVVGYGYDDTLLLARCGDAARDAGAGTPVAAARRRRLAGVREALSPRQEDARPHRSAPTRRETAQTIRRCSRSWATRLPVDAGSRTAGTLTARGGVPRDGSDRDRHGDPRLERRRRRRSSGFHPTTRRSTSKTATKPDRRRAARGSRSGRSGSPARSPSSATLDSVVA